MLFMKSRDGFALSIVMWIVAALLLGIALLLNLSRENLAFTKGVQDKLSARLQAQSYLEVIKYYVLTANYNSVALLNNVSVGGYKLPKKIVLDGREYNLSNHAAFSMQDVSSMINLRYPYPHIIAVLASRGNRVLYSTMRDSIADWIDKDNAVRLNGAEDAYYLKKKLVRYHPRNYPMLQSVEEIRLIRGVDSLSPSRFDRLKRYLYFLPRGATVNLSLIDTDYLAKLLHMDFQTADQLIELRKTDYVKYEKIIANNPHFDDNYMGFVPSFHIMIKIKIKMKDVRVKLETLIDFVQNDFRVFTTDYYKVY